MLKFDVFAYGFSLTMSSLSFIVTSFVIYTQRSSIKVLPKALRLFLKICCLPFVILISLTTAGMAVMFLFFPIQNYTVFTVLSCMFTFSAQMVRNFFFLFLLERILATVLLERYKWPDRTMYFWVLALPSLIISSVCITYFIQMLADIYISSAIPVDIVSYAIFIIHLLTIIICLMLGYLNKRMYKVMAYRISLKKRHHIMENIKILTFMLPAVMIYTFIAPIASVILIFSFMNYLPALPYCILHISQNVPIVLVFLYYRFIKCRGNENLTKINVVKNAFGQKIPITLTNDKYFQNLKQQWR